MKQNQIYFIALISTLLMANSLLAQVNIEGIVIDKLSKDPIVGASVSIKDGFDGATTNVDGKFKFSSDEKGNQIITVTYLGYKGQALKVNLDQNPGPLQIVLEEVPTDIGEVVISAGAFEASDEKKGVVLNALDIVTVPGANGDITGALNTLPGTTVSGETGQLIVRGGAANETRIYIDGLAVRNYYTTTVPELPARSRFSPFQFKGTTFASGGYSAEFGQALSATLSLNSPDWPTQGGINIGLSVIGLNGGITKIYKRSAISINGGYNNLGPYMRVVKQNLDFPKAPESGFVAIDGRVKTGEIGILKYGIQATSSRVKTGFPTAPFETTKLNIAINNVNTRGFVSWRQPVSEKSTLYTAVQGEANEDKITPDNVGDIKYKNYAMSTRVNLLYSPSKLIRWKNGGEFTWVKMAQTYWPSAYNHSIGAIYSELETYAGYRVVLRGGLRAERDFYMNQTNLAPRLSAAYKTGQNSQLSASWGIFHQATQDTILFRAPNLDFERAQHYILNYQMTVEGRIFRVETFYKKYNNLVQTQPELTNKGQGYAQGVELFFRDRKSLKWGDYWVSYSFLDTKRQWRNYPISTMPEFAARHNASLVFKYYFSKPQLSFNTSYTVQSGRPYYNPTPGVAFLSERTPTYHNFSVQLAKLTNIKGNFTIFVLSINNVLQLKQVFSYRFTPVPNTNPVEYYRSTVGPVAPSFFFVGCFINIGDKRTKVTKDEALE